jgi:cytochrome P450
MADTVRPPWQSDGETWARQRRLVAPNLNERISEKVWAESLTQARQMAAFILSKPAGLADDTISSLRAVAINVLGRVGYDQPKPFRPMELPRTPDAPMTYVEAISLCTELLVLAALLPGWLLRLPFMPTPIRTLGAAMAKLPGLTEEMLEEERRIAAETDTARDNIMSMLVRLSDQGKTDERLGKGGGAPTGQFLTEDEIAGNLFVFTGAGFDTTATTLTYAIALLAVYPQWQAWIQEEIDAVFGSAASADGTLDYVTCFPKLNRCLALMVRHAPFPTPRPYEAKLLSPAHPFCAMLTVLRYPVGDDEALPARPPHLAQHRPNANARRGRPHLHHPWALHRLHQHRGSTP